MQSSHISDGSDSKTTHSGVCADPVYNASFTIQL